LYRPSESKEVAAKTASKDKQPLGLLSVAIHEPNRYLLTSALHGELCRYSLDGDLEASCSTSSSWQASLHPTEDIIATAGQKATLNLLKSTKEEFGQQLATAAGRG
jgi:hypothetical protein